MKKKIKLPFIPNKIGIPNYDQTGDELREALTAWQEALDSGLNTEPSGELAAITQIPTISEKTKPSQKNGTGLGEVKQLAKLQRYTKATA